MSSFKGYWSALRQYLATPKGHHDFFDDLNAVGWIAAVVIAVWLLLRWFSILF